MKIVIYRSNEWICFFVIIINGVVWVNINIIVFIVVFRSWIIFVLIYVVEYFIGIGKIIIINIVVWFLVCVFWLSFDVWVFLYNFVVCGIEVVGLRLFMIKDIFR